ncbi:MAG: hypothetical protein ACJAYE_002380 [Candidatus Azotimanducaceae bacterium]|jgi:hypothetical protein
MKRNPLAKKYVTALGMKASAVKKPESECASCHFTPGMRNNRARILAGVSCQSCHGPAADWIEFHDEYGLGVTKETESLEHRQDRLQRMTDSGMIHPADLYGLARNCTSCHLVSSEWIVNNTDHSIGSDFYLLERSQGNIKHYPEADDARQYQFKIAGLIATLEVTYASLAEAEPGGRFGDAMTERATSARDELSALADSTQDPFLLRIASIAKSQYPKAGNAKLTAVAANIYNQSRQIKTRDGLLINTSRIASAQLELLRGTDEETRLSTLSTREVSYFFPLPPEKAKSVLRKHYEKFLRRWGSD